MFFEMKKKLIHDVILGYTASKTTSIKASANNNNKDNNNNNINVPDANNNNNGGGQTKSQKHVATPNSPVTTNGGETPVGTPATPNDGQQGGGGGGGGTKDKSLTVDKPTKDEKDGATKDTNDTKDKEDSFENHKPVIRDAKRADEIKKHGPVDQKRKDYKTLRYDIPSSDFDKSLGLPNLEEKEKQEAGK
uniref:Uncharacterized protein n=1 Tax=Panagrolaimus sp. ES5 TaxID=591445 RepID=A0AC34F282_9BILA